jgi:hypothetical protein
MKAPHTTRTANCNLNHLRRGATYRATTRLRTAIGEYLGLEAPHGDRAILLRHGAGTDSIALKDVTSLVRLAG